MLPDRETAGRLLSAKLLRYRQQNAIILAIPRGGVPVGFALSQQLQLPLELLLSKKIGHPQNKEYAIGAVSLDNQIIDNDYGVSKKYLDKEISKIRALLQQQYQLYKGPTPPLSVKDRVVIVTDDGIATGQTLLMGIAVLKKQSPAKIVAAIPVLPYSSIDVIKASADELEYLEAPRLFNNVGSFYDDFSEVTDASVIKMLSTRQ